MSSGQSTTRATLAGGLADPLSWGLVIALTAAAYVFGELIGPINATLAALLIGIVAGNTLPGVQRVDAVGTFMLKRALKFAIILLGAGIDASILGLVNLRTLGTILMVILLALG